MKCLLIADHASHTGGVSSVLISQAQGLKAIGIKVNIFTAFGPIADELLASAEDVYCLSPEEIARDRLSEIWNFRAAKELRLYLQKFDRKDTIIHIHSLSMGLSPSMGPVLKKSGIPYVVTAHDAGWACPTGYSYNFQTNTYCHLIPMSSACVFSNCDKRTYLHKAFKLAKCGSLDFVSGIKENAKCFITPSNLLKDRLLPRMPESVPVHVVLNPVHAIDLGPKSAAGNNFLFVGRLYEEKGILKLLEVIGDKYPLTVIGDGPLRSDLQKKYPKVNFKGWLSSDKILNEMRQARAFILPSICLDTAPLVVSEALSQGTPVIVSNRAGNSALVKNGLNGFVLDMSKPEMMNYYCNLLMDNKIAENMSVNAYREYWKEPMSVQRYVDRLMTIYENALQAGQESR